MKKQRNVDGSSATMKSATKAESSRMMTTAGKKSKHAVDKIEDERMNGGELMIAAATESFLEWEEWPWLRGVVDEQMSWGSAWLPYWDVGFMGEACNRALFSDVVWDYDIWDLRGIKEIPKG